MTKTLITGARVVFPNEIADVSVLIDGDKIADIDAAIQTTADQTVDATGLILFPGVIDDQVHFREPGLTHKEDLAHASRACAKGGVTTFLEMPNTVPPAVTQDGIDQKLALAAASSLVNYGFYIGATEDNAELLKSAQRVPGIKIFIGSSTGNLLVDNQDALERIFAETTLPICAHCEDETIIAMNRQWLGEVHSVHDHSQIRDVRAAVVSTARSIDLARRHNHRFHVLHVSTGVEATSILREHDNLITAEVCPHHLFFNTGDYDRLGSRVQMNPSIKSAADNASLWKALLEGRIQVIATDHAPHTLEEKSKPYPQSPSGLPAVENSLALMLNEANRGRVSYLQIAHWMCDAPARVWDIVNKGRIAVGYDADLVLVNPNLAKLVRDEDQETKAGWSPWHGETLTGWPVRTWVMGQEVYNDGEFNVEVRGKPAEYDHARGGYWATA